MIEKMTDLRRILGLAGDSNEGAQSKRQIRAKVFGNDRAIMVKLTT
jgi:hypothetical protein